MAISKRLIILFGLGLAELSLLSATEAEREEPAMISAIWLNPNTPTIELFVRGHNNQLRRLIVGTHNRGIPIRVKAAGKPVVILGKVIEPPPLPTAVIPAKPVERYVSVGEIVWPEVEDSTALLVLAQVNAPDQPLSIIGRSLSDGLKNFPPDSLRVVNFSSINLISQIGKEVTTIDAGTNFMVRYPIASEPGRTPLSHLSFKFVGGDFLYDSEVDTWQGSRTIALIYEAKNEVGQKTLPVRMIVDLPQVTAAETEPATKP